MITNKKEAIEKLKEGTILLKKCAEELRNAQNYLGEILGRFTADDLLGKIFNTFCVGK